MPVASAIEPSVPPVQRRTMVFSWCSMNAENGSAPRASASVFTFVPFGTAPHRASYTCCAACAKRSASPGCVRGGISRITGGMP